jgi:hypothetical protein
VYIRSYYRGIFAVLAYPWAKGSYKVLLSVDAERLMSEAEGFSAEVRYQAK